jgi:hypothetical protein
LDELTDIEATFTDAKGDKFTVRSCRSIGGCLAFADRPIKSVEFSLDAYLWAATPTKQRERHARLRWVGDCRDCVDASEVGVELVDPSISFEAIDASFSPEPKIQPWCEP